MKRMAVVVCVMALLLGIVAPSVANAQLLYGSVVGNVKDTSDAAVRTDFPPLNPPASGATGAQVQAANMASIAAFHQAMFVAAGLLVIGAAVVWYGLRERQTTATGEVQAEAVG